MAAKTLGSRSSPSGGWRLTRTTGAQWSLFPLKSITFLGRKILGHLGYFRLNNELSAPILVQWVPCPCFPLFNNYFYKKLSLYIHIPNIYLGLLGFEFGPQRTRDLAFVCPTSVVHVSHYGLHTQWDASTKTPMCMEFFFLFPFYISYRHFLASS